MRARTLTHTHSLTHTRAHTHTHTHTHNAARSRAHTRTHTHTHICAGTHVTFAHVRVFGFDTQASGKSRERERVVLFLILLTKLQHRPAVFAHQYAVHTVLQPCLIRFKRSTCLNFVCAKRSPNLPAA